MIRLAKTLLPEVPLHVGDLRTLDLGRRFDVVTRLFGVIAHVGSRDELRTAVARLTTHLNQGGVLAVEPWFTRRRSWSAASIASAAGSRGITWCG